MQLIRGSELNDFLRCRLRWKWAWVDNLRPKKPNSKLLIGTMIHKFLEVYYSTGQNSLALREMKAMFDETAETGQMDEAELNDLWDLANKVTANYVRTYDRDLDEYNVIATELTFAIPLDEEVVYTGTIDLIMRDREGRIWFFDHKTTQSIDKYDKNSDMDRQISRYWWALQQLQKGNGYILDKSNDRWIWNGDNALDGELFGFMYNIILKDYPVPPKVLKSGALSKDKSQKTTYEMYTQAIKENDLDANDYLDFLIHLQDYPKEFFRRLRVIRGQAEIDASIEELWQTAQDMKPEVHTAEIHKPGPRIYRNITSDCSWDCPFREICVASMDGSNVDFLMDSLYTREENVNHEGLEQAVRGQSKKG